MKRRKFISAALAAGMVLSGTALASAATKAPAKISIGATLMDSQVAWFQWVQQGMEAAAKKYNVKLVVVNTQGDPGKEVSTVQNFVQQKMSGIVVGAASQTASAAALRKAVAKGIKVIAYNSLVGKAGEFPFVGVDNKQLGIMNGTAAKSYIQTSLGGNAKIAIIYQPKYGVIALSRTDGFQQVLKGMAGVTIVDKQIGDTQEDTQTKVQNMLTAHPDIQIIDTWNESSFLGALAAVKAAGKSNSVKVYGVDMSPQVTAAFQAGDTIGAVATQEPVNIGYIAVEEAIKAVKGQKVPKDTRVPVASVTKATLAAFLTTHPYYVVK
jgi:ABC-type sugar transport system substrate-binding protein